jgi:large subunit ribosomal protein L6
MSKVGKKPINIPDNVQIKYQNNVLSAQGPLGNITFNIPTAFIDLSVQDKEILVTRRNDSKLAKSLHGTIRRIINNMIIGVTQGYSKSLIVEGIGYKAALEQDAIKLDVGYSHPVYIKIPKDIKVTVDKNKITIFGVDKQVIGDFAQRIKNIRPPDAYKGKGIRFEGEILKLKPGKKAGASASASA